MRALVAVILLASCQNGPSPPSSPPPSGIDAFLPGLPPIGGPALAAAGQLTDANFAAERIPGPASRGLVGDFFLRNDKIRVVVQAPGRSLGPCIYGGNVIDVDRVGAPAGDQFGEVAPLLQLGRTVDFQMPELLRDGSQGGPAVLRLRGRDVKNDSINLTGLGGPLAQIAGEERPTVDLGLVVVVTYVLSPGATTLKVYYTLYNPRQAETDTMFGILGDKGGQVELFHPRFGFGEFSFGDVYGGNGIPSFEYVALQGQGVAYGLLSVEGSAATYQVPFPLPGILAEAYDVMAWSDAIGTRGRTVRIPGGVGVTREVDLTVGSDLADVESAVRVLKHQATATVSGKVTTASGRAVGAGVRVVADDANGAPRRATLTVFTTDAQGGFHGALLPGSYLLQAEGDNYLRGAPVPLAVTAGAPVAPTLTIPDGVPIAYRIHDRTATALPGRVVVVGAQASAPDRRFRDTVKDFLPLGVAGAIDSLAGDSSKGTRHDHPLIVVPGHYRVVVQRGPEWSRFEQVLDVGAPPGGAMVDATLDRVIDTTGYLACDFHQHTNASFDTPVPPEDRVVSLLASGVEFTASNERDFQYDLGPDIQALGVGSLLGSVVGVQVTTFDYGHFSGFPVTVDPHSRVGGALDWTGGPGGLDLPPTDLFAGLRKLGALVLIADHPRAAPGADPLAQTTRYFDRAGLTYDFTARSFGSSPALEAVKPVELGLPDGTELFAPVFNAVEVYSGHDHVIDPEEGERVDPITENVMRDWMNFLSVGFTPTALGGSDSQEWVSSPAGMPRSMVRVPDDSPAAIARGVGDAIVKTVSGGSAAPRDVVVTNGPMLSLLADGKGIGQTVAHGSAAPLQIALRVQTPAWAPVETVEVFSNTTFDLPPRAAQMPSPLFPVLCFTTRGTPTQRCAAAFGGARPLVFQTVSLPTGGTRLEANLSVSVDLIDLLRHERPGAHGQDVWLVARATGNVGLFPTLPLGLTNPADLPDVVDRGTAALAGKGFPALAFTNPVFVDFDGGGWHAPFGK